MLCPDINDWNFKFSIISHETLDQCFTANWCSSEWVFWHPSGEITGHFRDQSFLAIECIASGENTQPREYKQKK